MNRKQGIEEVGESDTVSLGDQAEQRPVAIETPGLTNDGDFKRRFAVPVRSSLPRRPTLVGLLDPPALKTTAQQRKGFVYPLFA